MGTLHTATPLLLSHPLSKLTGKNIYLKMEALQPSGSFKDRGVGALCQYYAEQGAKGLISSSGGNAGLAVAYASNALQVPAKVIMPITTPSLMEAKIRAENVQVSIAGENWDESDKIAQQISKDENLAYIPPFNHPIIWKGYISIIQELKEDGIKPDAIIVSVGGGGLYSGLVQGLHHVGWSTVAMITAETEGAASFAKAYQQKKRIRLDKIDTIATTLGAKQICEEAFQWSQQHPTFPQIVTDKDTVNACTQFTYDHRILVEPACGAALAIIYNKLSILEQFNHIVVIVCGGSGITLDLLQQWKSQYSI